MASTPTVADVFRRFGSAYHDRFDDRMPIAHLKAMHAIVSCRTPALGGHLYECDHCHKQHFVYHSCRNRHCPTCQFLPTELWIDARRKDLLPIPYFHVVFTLPAQLRHIFRANQRVCYKLLFQVASQTLLTLTADPEHLGAQIGFIAVLHTWSQTLAYHPHLHCIVTGGGLSPNHNHWISSSPKFFVHVDVLGALFRGKLLDALKIAVGQGDIQIDPNTSWKALLATLYHRKWNVDCRKPFAGPRHVVDYIGRYTHRVAISNHRIKAIHGDHVSFRYRDPHDPARSRTMVLPAIEFIRRFLQHILPSGFVKIRHYGILANRNRKALVSRARRLLLVSPDPELSDLNMSPMPASPPSRLPSDSGHATSVEPGTRLDPHILHLSR